MNELNGMTTEDLENLLQSFVSRFEDAGSQNVMLALIGAIERIENKLFEKSFI